MSAGGDEDATGPSLAGFLLKHPGKGLFRKYKKRWFALGNLSLSYAKTEGGPPLRTIRCRDVISCTGIPGIPVKAKAAHDGLGIALHFEDRAIVLLAPDPIAREQWIQAIGIAQKIDNGEMAAAPPSAAPPPPAVSAHPPSASPPADSPSPASSAPPASSRRGGDAGAGSGSGSGSAGDVARKASGIRGRAGTTRAGTGTAADAGAGDDGASAAPVVASGKVAAMQARLAVASADERRAKRASARPSRYSRVVETEKDADVPGEDQVFASVMVMLGRTMDVLRVKLEFKRELAPFFKAAGAMRDAMLATTTLIDTILYAALDEDEASVDDSGSDSGSASDSGADSPAAAPAAARTPTQLGSGPDAYNLDDDALAAFEAAYETILEAGQQLILSSRDTFRDDPPVPTAWSTRRTVLDNLRPAVAAIITTPARRDELAKFFDALVAASDATRPPP